MKTILADLPKIYSQFLPDLLHCPIPVETLATCDSCAMCLPSGTEPIRGVTYFKPDVKCCSYFPDLPNYLVGGVLTTTGQFLANGRERLARKIRDGTNVSPLGIFPDVSEERQMDRYTRGFGKDRSLLCPYFSSDNGECTIWPFRESVCSTYFCKFVAGEDGRAFWAALQKYLFEVERLLSRSVAGQLGCVLEESRRCNSDMPPRTAWGSWTGRKEDYFRECFAVVGALSNSDFELMASGSSLGDLLQRLEFARNLVVTPSLPSRLVKNPALREVAVDSQSCVVITEMGTFELPLSVAGYLKWFDGSRDNDSIIHRIRSRDRVSVDRSFLLALYRNQILIAAHRDAPPNGP